MVASLPVGPGAQSRRRLSMSRTLHVGLASFATVVLLSAASLQPAAARIPCDGDFQVTKYGPVARSKLLKSQTATDGAFQRLRSTRMR